MSNPVIGSGRTRDWLIRLDKKTRVSDWEERMQLSGILLIVFAIVGLHAIPVWPGPWWSCVLTIGGLAILGYLLCKEAEKVGKWDCNRRWKRKFMARCPDLNYVAVHQTVGHMLIATRYTCISFRRVAEHVLFHLDDEMTGDSTVQTSFGFEVCQTYKHFACGVDLPRTVLPKKL